MLNSTRDRVCSIYILVLQILKNKNCKISISQFNTIERDYSCLTDNNKG